MGKNKLKRFAENENFAHLVQPSREEILNDFYLKGRWHQDFFKNEHPIVLELGCGKGEYTVGLGKKFHDKNFIGIDIKGARIWCGAKTVEEENLQNIGFLRTQIELLEYAFAEREVSEIWITFPDPQIKYRRTKHRLTHPDFLKKYQKIIEPEGTIHLKTDSAFLYGYTLGIIEEKGYAIQLANHDIYNKSNHDLPSYLREIQTYYEKMFLKEHKKITYLQFSFETNKTL